MLELMSELVSKLMLIGTGLLMSAVGLFIFWVVFSEMIDRMRRKEYQSYMNRMKSNGSNNG
tara:strand:- start:108 stop:290 length:183 start_codon:yes stop_codon:yes gene_type:complete